MERGDKRNLKTCIFLVFFMKDIKMHRLSTVVIVIRFKLKTCIGIIMNEILLIKKPTFMKQKQNTQKKITTFL